MTYIWQVHDDYPESMIGEYDRKNGPDRFLLKKGQSLVEESAPWRFTFRGSVTRLREFDDLANNAMVPLISPRLAQLVLARANEEVELLPAEIEARDGAIHDYHLLNALTRLPVVDRLNSQCTLVPGSDAIMKIRKLVLMDGCLKGHHLARCAEYSAYLLVSEQMATSILHAGMIGMQLTNPQDVRP